MLGDREIRIMKKLSVLLIAGSLLIGSMGNALAEDAGPFATENFSATLTFTTDYVFRGISFSGEAPAIQGSFDWGYGNWFAGVWGSSIKGEAGLTGIRGGSEDGFELELDYYAGYANSYAGFDWYVMPIYYHFPDAGDDFGALAFPGRSTSDLETDQFEVWMEISRTFDLGGISPTAGLFYAVSPDFTLEDGTGHYIEGKLAFDLGMGFGIDGSYGYQTVDGDDTSGSSGAFCDPAIGSVTSIAGGSICDGYSYTNWSVGITKSLVGFDADLRYHDTNDDDETGVFYGTSILESRVVFSLSRSF